MSTVDDIKARHRAMWALGDYPKVALKMLSPLGTTLVAACGVGPGQRVLDVAAGAGNSAIQAAAAGAEVTASDLVPKLLAAGARQAAERGITLDWVEADAEALPFPDDDFDVVMSSIGVMFAPNHQRAADELVRVCRPGGVIGVLSWTPTGAAGQLFKTMAPYAPPPPPGAQPPALWGTDAHLRELLGDQVTGLQTSTGAVLADQFADPAEFVDFYRTYFGPAIVTFRNVADDPDRTAALERDLLAYASAGPQGGPLEFEYLLATARKRAPA